jgi:hypothetical protein
VRRHFQLSEEAAWVVGVARRVVGEKQRWMACLCYVEELLAVLRQAIMLQPATDMEVTGGHQQEVR